VLKTPGVRVMREFRNKVSLKFFPFAPCPLPYPHRI